MMRIRVVLTLAFLLVAPLASAEDINGFWQHPDEPAWIEIRLADGKGIVVRNDKFPERVGREILKDLEADESKKNLWRGQVYAERMGDYTDAAISLPEPDSMKLKVKVGIMSFSVEWVRVDGVPDAAAE